MDLHTLSFGSHRNTLLRTLYAFCPSTTCPHLTQGTQVATSGYRGSLKSYSSLIGISFCCLGALHLARPYFFLLRAGIRGLTWPNKLCSVSLPLMLSIAWATTIVYISASLGTLICAKVHNAIVSLHGTEHKKGHTRRYRATAIVEHQLCI